ncbi:replication protein P, partial [Escherichia coli]|nr:replication protein P [Escherichia coli]
PASVSTIREQNKLNEFRKQWMLAFLENGITTMELVNAGMRHARASESPFWPSPGQFIKWCKDSKMVLGVTIDDVMA